MAKEVHKPEEMDAFIEHRAKAIKSTMDRGPIGPQEQGISNCFKGHSKIHNFYTKASILLPRGIVNLDRV